MPTKIDDAFARTLSSEIQAAVEAVAKRHGFALATTVSCRYAKAGDQIRFSAVEFTANAEPAMSPDAAAYKAHARRFGLDPSTLGREITISGVAGVVKIVGLRPKARRAPVIVERAGKQYIVDVPSVRAALGA